MLSKSIKVVQHGNQIKFYDGDKSIQTCNTAYCVRMMKDISMYFKKQGCSNVTFQVGDLKSCSTKI